MSTTGLREKKVLVAVFTPLIFDPKAEEIYPSILALFLKYPQALFPVLPKRALCLRTVVAHLRTRAVERKLCPDAIFSLGSKDHGLGGRRRRLAAKEQLKSDLLSCTFLGVCARVPSFPRNIEISNGQTDDWEHAQEGPIDYSAMPFSSAIARLGQAAIREVGMLFEDLVRDFEMPIFPPGLQVHLFVSLVDRWRNNTH